MQQKRQTRLMTFSLKLAAVLVIRVVSFGQTPTPVPPPPAPTPIQNLFAGGASYNFNSQQNIAATFLYGHLVTSPGTYFFSVVDVVPTTKTPITATTNIGAGLAQKMFTFGKVSLVLPTTAGVSWNGANVGWQWTGGLALPISLGHNLYLVPTVRYLQSTVSNVSQPVVGIDFGFGK